MFFYTLIYQKDLKEFRNGWDFFTSHPYYRTFFHFVPDNGLLFCNMLISKDIYYFTDKAHCEPDHEANIKHFNESSNHYQPSSINIVVLIHSI